MSFIIYPDQLYYVDYDPKFSYYIVEDLTDNIEENVYRRAACRRFYHYMISKRYKAYYITKKYKLAKLGETYMWETNESRIEELSRYGISPEFLTLPDVELPIALPIDAKYIAEAQEYFHRDL